MLRLALFDLDGTLIDGRDHLNAEAIRAGITAGFGLSEAKPEDVPHAGFTDRATLLAVAIHHGLEQKEAHQKVDEVLRVKDEVLKRLLGERPEDAPIRATPGAITFVQDLLEAGVVCGLVTGNTPYAAYSKLERAGFAREWFRLGSFGDRCETRVELVKHALAAASRNLSELRRGEVVVVGDTSLDITSGNINGTHTLAVLTGRGTKQELLRSKPSLLVNTFVQPHMLQRLLAIGRVTNSMRVRRTHFSHGLATDSSEVA